MRMFAKELIDLQPDVIHVTTAIAANKNAGIATVADIVKQASDDPQKLNYGTGGPGSMPHLTMELLKLRAKVNITHVPFAGGGPAMQAAVAGTTQLTAGALANVHAQLKGGLLRGVAITSAERWHDLPDIPTMIEAGYPDFVMETTHVLVAPAGTPAPIIAKLNEEFVRIGSLPAFLQKNMIDLGLEPILDRPADFARYLEQNRVVAERVVQAAGLEPQ
jgi:tripartite-type tricarboxylate transporter receptor subunit TctC